MHVPAARMHITMISKRWTFCGRVKGPPIYGSPSKRRTWQVRWLAGGMCCLSIMSWSWLRTEIIDLPHANPSPKLYHQHLQWSMRKSDHFRCFFFGCRRCTDKEVSRTRATTCVSAFRRKYYQVRVRCGLGRIKARTCTMPNHMCTSIQALRVLKLTYLTKGQNCCGYLTC